MARQITLLAQPNGTFKISRLKKRKSPVKIAFIKIKLFFWNLSPLHWYDDFKDLDVTLEEFACKKTLPKK
jgi:hypothetical protein